MADRYGWFAVALATSASNAPVEVLAGLAKTARAAMAVLDRDDSATLTDPVPLLDLVDDATRFRWVCTRSRPGDDLEALFGVDLVDSHEARVFCESLTDSSPRHVTEFLFGVAAELRGGVLFRSVLNAGRAPGWALKLAADHLAELVSDGHSGGPWQVREAVALLACRERLPLDVVDELFAAAAAAGGRDRRTLEERRVDNDRVAGWLVEELCVAGPTDDRFEVRAAQLRTVARASPARGRPALCGYQLFTGARGPRRDALVELAHDLAGPGVLDGGAVAGGPGGSTVCAADLFDAATGSDPDAHRWVMDEVVVPAATSGSAPLTAGQRAAELAGMLLVRNPAVGEDVLGRFVEIGMKHLVADSLVAGRAVSSGFAGRVMSAGCDAADIAAVLDRVEDPVAFARAAVASPTVHREVLEVCCGRGLLEGPEVVTMAARCVQSLGARSAVLGEHLAGLLGSDRRRWDLFVELAAGSEATVAEVLDSVEVAFGP